MSADDVRERPAIDPAVLEARRGRPWSLRVVGARDVTSRMRRVELTGDALDEFKPRPAQELVLQIPQESGEAARRHYTIRHYDERARRIDVDFVLHEHETPGVLWARQANLGQAIDVRGPRGRIALAADADWHLFSGDETAQPAIFALLEALPAGAKAHVFLEMADEGEEQALATRADVKLEWLLRNGAAPGARPLLVDAVASFRLPPGRGHAFVLGETGSVRARRHDLLARGMERTQIYAEGYWRPDRIGGHDHVED
jgi:NADPH-dependent ferric siderophore reductase